MKLVAQVEVKYKRPTKKFAFEAVIHPDQCIDVNPSYKTLHTGKTLVLLKHARALEQIKSLSVALSSAAKQNDCM